jgi:hypothetical protein
MSFQEDLAKLYKKVGEAVKLGVISPQNKEETSAILTHILNECEKSRQACLNNVENLKRQVSQLEGQAQGLASLSSIVFNVINAQVLMAEREEAERLRNAEELREKQAYMEQLKAQEAAKQEETTTQTVSTPPPAHEETKRRRRE